MAVQAINNPTYEDVNVSDDLTVSGIIDGTLAVTMGHIYGYDTNTTVSISGTGVDNKVQILAFSANGRYNGTTPSYTDGHIEVDEDGLYRCQYTINVSSTGGSAYKMAFELWKNNGATFIQGSHIHIDFSGGGNDLKVVCNFTYDSFVDGDTIELWCYNETNTNDIIVDDSCFEIKKVGEADDQSSSSSDSSSSSSSSSSTSSSGP